MNDEYNKTKYNMPSILDDYNTIILALGIWDGKLMRSCTKENKGLSDYDMIYDAIIYNIIHTISIS